jgi:hypothetical protein
VIRFYRVIYHGKSLVRGIFLFLFEVDIEVENEADISWILREWSVMNST